MSEYDETGLSPEALIQNSLSTYNSDVVRLCESFPPSAIEESEREPTTKIVTFETPRYTVELPDGTPRLVSYASYPSGSELFPTLRTVTILADPVEDLGAWMTNYALHQLDDGSIEVEKDEWFQLKPVTRQTLENNQISPALSGGGDTTDEPLTAMAALSAEERRIVIEEIRERLRKVHFDTVSKEEISLLKDHLRAVV